MSEQPARKRGALADAGESSASGPEKPITEMSIDVEFEGRSPELTDFHCVKQLLQQLFLKASVNLSDMSIALITQTKIGSVIKQVFDDDDEDDDDNNEDNDDVDVNQVFGITSILNISEKTSECIGDLQKLLLDLSNQHSDSVTTRFVNKLFTDKNCQVGLLINERYVNIPPPICVPLFQAVRKEVSNAKSKNPSYNFEYLIMICKLYKVKKDKKVKTFEDSEVIWSNAEEEYFDEAADFKFEFCVQNEKGSGLAGNWVESDPEMIPFRRVLIFTMEKFYTITNQLSVLLAGRGINYASEYQPIDLHED